MQETKEHPILTTNLRRRRLKIGLLSRIELDSSGALFPQRGGYQYSERERGGGTSKERRSNLALAVTLDGALARNFTVLQHARSTCKLDLLRNQQERRRETGMSAVYKYEPNSLQKKY